MMYAINAPHLPEAHGAYSQGTTAGRLIFCSGQLAVDKKNPGRVVEGGAAAQTERIVELISELLAEVNCTLSDVAQTTIYLRNLEDATSVDAVLATHFQSPQPARSLVEVSKLPLDALVEIDCVACR